MVSREVTQAKMALLGDATLRHKPSQLYTVADRVEERAREYPDRPFLILEGEGVTYGQLNGAANRVARRAAAAGLGKGDVVALMMQNRPAFVATWIGLAKLGITTSLLGTQLREGQLEHALEVSGARHLIIGSECLASLEGAADDLIVEVVPDEPLLAERAMENPDRQCRAGLTGGDDLFLIFTSGTTGMPKAARLSHMRFLGVGDGMAAVADYGPEDVVYCVLPLYHGAGGMVVISSALAVGASVLLRRKLSISAFWQDVRSHRVTAFQYVGEMCRYLLNQPESPLDRDHRLRVVMGAGLGADLWHRFRERFGIEHILEGWSSTEANTSLINLDNRPGSCGRIPFPERHNGRLVRYDVESDTHPRDDHDHMIECDAGETGEFIGRILDLPDCGAGRFEGYTSSQENEHKILRDVFETGDAWYRSGDLLQRDEHDYYYFVDRLGDTYRWKSENVSTQEVAGVLCGFPGIEVANVYGVRVPRHEGRAGMAALVMAQPEHFDGKCFHAFVAERLPSYAQPLFLRLGREADTTATFKLRKVALVRAGYDPERVEDALLVLDAGRESYVPLTAASLSRAGLPAFDSAGE